MIKEFYVVCDNVRSLENVGSVFRTADGLGVAKIFLCGITGTPPNHKISKTALGAENMVPFAYHQQAWRLLDRLRSEGVRIVALEQHRDATDLTVFKPHFPLALVIGNEVKGVSSSALQRCDAIIEIPMQGKKESLNVAVAFGIAGYEISKSRIPSSK